MLVMLMSMALGLIVILLLTLVVGRSMDRNMMIRRMWIRFAIRLLGLRVRLEGRVPTEPALFASNHRSFVDPLIALAYIYAYPLAKAEVGKYPMIGFAAYTTGVLYVERNSLGSRLDARRAIGEAFARHRSVLIYPEGTTVVSAEVGTFKKGSFEIAVAESIPVVPVAIEFRKTDDHWGKRSLLHQYIHQFGKWRSHCSLAFGEPMTHVDGVQLCVEVRQWINARVAEFRRKFDQEDKGVVPSGRSVRKPEYGG